MCVFGILEKFQKKTKGLPFEKFCPSSNRFRSGHPERSSQLAYALHYLLVFNVKLRKSFLLRTN
jgi:hypothetical protein